MNAVITCCTHCASQQERLRARDGREDDHREDRGEGAAAVRPQIRQQPPHDGVVVDLAQLVVVPAVGAAALRAGTHVPSLVAPAAGSGATPHTHR